MTVSTLQNKIIYTTTGQTTYAFEFHTQVGSTIKVYLDDVLQTGGYNVLLNSDQVNSPGGAVQFDPTAPVAGLTLLIRREIPEQQNIDLEPYDPFPAEVAEDGFDKMTLITQQNSEGLSRAVKASGSDDGSTDFTLPAYVAGKGLMWDETTKSLTNSDDDLNGITDAAQASANAAAISEGNAATSEANAATSETNAANSEANALSYQNFAQQWSSAPSDQTVNDGINPPGLSAYHWALVSQSSAAGLHYQGTWDPNSGAYPTNPGPSDLWVANAEGTFDGKTWNPGDWLVRNTANTAWDQVPQTTAWDTIINVPSNVANALSRLGDTATGKVIFQAGAESSIVPVDAADLTRKDVVDSAQGPNLIDNPDFAVAQTGTTITLTASGGHIFDRWYAVKGTGGSATIDSLLNSATTQNTSGVRNYLRFTSTGVTTTDNRIWQILPGTRLAGEQVSLRLKTYADSAQTVNIQLRVYADATNFNSVDLTAQPMGVGTWLEHTFTGTMPDVPNFTLTSDARIMVIIVFQNITDTIWRVSEIDMRQGNYVPPFVYPDYNEELEKAKYYFERLQAEGAPNTNINFGMTYSVNTTTSQLPISFKKKYKIPTITTDAAANFTLFNNGASTPLTSIAESTTYTGKSSSLILLNHAAIGVTARAATLENTAAQLPFIDIDARPI